MYDVITIGSSLVDIFIHSHSFSLQSTGEGVLLCQRYGSKLAVDDFYVLTGGGGGNTAVGFARQGFRTGVISELGRDVFARMILNEFHQEKVMTNLIIKEKKEQTGGSVILIDDRGGRTVLVHRGASSMLDPGDISKGPVARAGWVHLASLHGQKSTIETIFVLRKEAGNLSWNPGKQELNLLRHHQFDLSLWPVSVFMVNREEWLMLGKVSQLILKKTPVVIITQGSQLGAVIAHQQSFTFQPPKVTSVDDTGAGDAFAVGFIVSYIRHQPIPSAIKHGVANAQSVVKYFGAKKGLLTQLD